MSDLVVGAGLVLVVEGLLWAAAPGLAMRMLLAAKEMPEPTLRLAGLIALAAGVGLIWLVRG